ncbi:mannose-specific lectin 2-like [Dendrobium catenatum]|nr:mannose-specific lectin 2-like [Dendrobium catenatum]
MAMMMNSTNNIPTRSSTSIFIICVAALLLIFAPSYSNSSASSMQVGDILNTGDSLILSGCTLTMESDCLLILYAIGSSIWDSKTSGKGDHHCQAKLNNDGQLVILSGAGNTVWGSPYQGPISNYVLEFNGDCYIGIRDLGNGHTVWSTCPIDLCVNQF